MKKIIFTSLFLLSIKCFGQVIADPALSQMRFTALFQDTALNAATLPLDNVIRLKVPVANRNINNALPSGTCKIKIGLGSKLVLDPNFNLATVNTSSYFNWTSEFYAGQVQITGELVNQLPANFLDTAVFNVKGSLLGSSTITTNFLITNHNTTVILSDEDPTNNTSFIVYTIIQAGGPIPVHFTKLMVSKDACNIVIHFDAENEVNVKRYEIELSKDGIHFFTTGQLTANNLIHYQYNFPITADIKGPFIYVRIRSLDNDDKFQYSETRKISGNCAQGWKASLYPNPVPHNTKQVTITTEEGLFNGNYKLSLFDVTGRSLNTRDLNVINTDHLNYETGNLPAGEYILKLMNDAGTQSAVLRFQKL